MGRTLVLKNSMIEMKSANHRGVPKGRNWAKNLNVLYVILDKIIDNQVSHAAPREKIIWTVEGKKYGFILKMLRNKIVKNKVKIKEETNLRYVFLEFWSWKDQKYSNWEDKVFLLLVKK